MDGVSLHNSQSHRSVGPPVQYQVIGSVLGQEQTRTGTRHKIYVIVGKLFKKLKLQAGYEGLTSVFLPQLSCPSNTRASLLG